MAYIYTGETGIPLQEIIQKLGNKNYPCIDCRCKWTDKNGEKFDELWGECAYKNGKLIALDGDTYSLDDLYTEWKEYSDHGVTCLTVWEEGRYSDV